MRLALLLSSLLLPATLLAQEPVVQPHTVTVSATASVQRAPDQATLDLAVETFAATAEQASRANAQKMDALVKALERLGLKGDRIRTIGYNVYPEYEHRPESPRQPGEERVVGYRATNMVQVTIDDVSRVGTIIDAAIKAGANRVTGLSFQLRNPEAARQEALRLAVGKARADAEAIAGAVGQRVGPALAVTTAGAFPPPRIMRAQAGAMMEYSKAPTPVEPGTIDISADVTVIFTLETGR
jgi:uncharacterized protein YggE